MRNTDDMEYVYAAGVDKPSTLREKKMPASELHCCRRGPLNELNVVCECILPPKKARLSATFGRCKCDASPPAAEACSPVNVIAVAQSHGGTLYPAHLPNGLANTARKLSSLVSLGLLCLPRLGCHLLPHEKLAVWRNSPSTLKAS